MLEALEHTWQRLCDTYDAAADLPDLPTLFEGADLAAPDRAAETVLANMLLEAMYSISRFSPWYKKPLGLRLIRDEATHCSQWALSASAYSQWQAVLGPLAAAIRRNVGLILAADMVDGLAQAALPADRVTATCLCVPARIICVKRAVLLGADVICDACGQPFRLVEASDSAGSLEP